MVDISGRRETTATGPAWQVRESARQKILKRLQQRVTERLEEIQEKTRCVGYQGTDMEVFHYIFLALQWRSMGGMLTWEYAGKKGVSAQNLTELPMPIRKQIADLVLEIGSEVKAFQHTKEEGDALSAKLLEWTAGEIARPYHSALREQEIRQPKLIYGVEDRTEEIPFE